MTIFWPRRFYFGSAFYPIRRTHYPFAPAIGAADERGGGAQHWGCACGYG
jgi:hypothetical protein